jgi:glycerol-3-phosphate acyltransferase PlsY
MIDALSSLNGPPAYAVALLFGYLCGSIPFGLLITRMAGTADIRTIGSGNIGATNVLRTGRKSLAAATLLCDALKGALPVLLVWHVLGPDAALVAGLGAFLGHVYPVWLGFRGGKGVATYLGVLIAVSWPAALVFAAVWLVTAFATRYSSLAALAAGVAVPVSLWIMGDLHAAILFAVLSAFTSYTHRGNIARLRDGTEGKIGAK